MDMFDSDELGEGQELTQFEMEMGELDVVVIEELGLIPVSIVETFFCEGICDHCAHTEPRLHVSIGAGSVGYAHTLVLN